MKPRESPALADMSAPPDGKGGAVDNDTLFPDRRWSELEGGLEHEHRRRAIEAALFGGVTDTLRLDRYQLLEQLGEGGMGTIFAGRDGVTGESVAIKLMQELGPDARRFEREIAVLAGLHHARIVRYVGHGTTADGRRYLVMERLSGEDLRSHLGRRRPTVEECIALGVDVAEGLQFAHEHGFIHRDIKPSNIFLVGGVMAGAKILDFGLARASQSMPSVTHTGAILGTIGYMAPEQARGDPSLDHRADIFSLGCVLYEALAGQPPFVGEHPVAVLAKILLEEPRPLRSLRPEIPARLAEVVHQALAKRPEDRPTSAAAMLAALRRCAAAGPPAPAPAVRASVVSYREQRAICLLLVAGEARPIDPLAATVVTRPGDASVQGVAAAHGATATPLLDGSEILVFELDGSVADVVARAARCALSIRAARPGARQALALGRGEQRGDSVVGDVIDAVSHLLRRSGAGAILVDERAVRTLGPSFEVAPDREHARLVGEREEPALQLLLGKPSPFVGRSREMGWLAGLFEHACEMGRSTAAVIVAPPGIGKSRLWREFARGLVAAGHDPRIFVIRCTATLQSSPLGALGAALRSDAGILGGDEPVQAGEKFLARFGVHAPAGQAAAHRAHFLAELCGVDLGDALAEVVGLARRDPAVMADAQRLAWLDWLQAEAELRPLVVVVEDLHWCDERTADFVQAAARDLAEHRLMLIATARPEVATRFPAPWPGPDAESLTLAPLHARAGEMLIRQALGKVAPEVIASLVARAEGNPFFLEELVRTLGSGPATTLPDSVLAVVQVRLDRLDDEERRLLRAASVFDGAFDPAGVACLLGSPPPDVLRRIEGLVAAEVLAVEHGADGAVHRFRHALLRDAAYATLSDADRPAAHRAAAEWLAAAGGYEPAAIAAHYAQGDAPAAAGEWYAQAARRALACADVSAAAGHAARALACGVDGRALAEVRLVQADVALWGGDVPTADHHARDALALVEPGSEPWFTTLRRCLACAFLGTRMHEVRALTDRVRAFQGATSSERLLCLAEAAFDFCVSGAVDEARTIFAEVDALAMDAVAPLVRASIHRVRTALASHDQNLWAGLREAERAIAAFEEAGDVSNGGRLRATLAWLLMAMGAFARAESVLQEGFRLSRRVGNEHAALYLTTSLAALRLKQGRLDEATQCLTELIERAQARGERRVHSYAFIFRMRLDDAAGAIDDDALARARAGVAATRPFASLHILATAILARGLARRRELDEATGLARGGLARLRDFSSAIDDPFFVWSSFAEILDLGGAPGEADHATLEALTWLARLHAEIDDPELRRDLVAYTPVGQLLARARERELALDAGLAAALA